MPSYRKPVAEIQFAAKAGFLSRSLWEEFFAKGTNRWRRKRWQLLRERGHFAKYPSRLTNDVLVLNRRCPLVLALVGKAISTHPFVSQIEHDESVAKILLTLAQNPNVLDFRFEAELKREEWAVKGPHRWHTKSKFPDGVIEISGPRSPTKIAIEVETSKKDQKRYREILTTYSTRRDLSKVLFLARSKPIFENLRVAMRETYYPDWERPVGFCDLDSWLRNPATSPIHFSEGETTFEKIIASSSERMSPLAAL